MASTNLLSDPLPPREGRSLGLFIVTVLLCGLTAILGVFKPEVLAAWGQNITNIAFRNLDWFFLASMTVFLLLCFWLGFSRHGFLRLGRPGEKPEFSTLSWLSMLFAAGMGVGIMFWGVAEPITHFAAPPTIEGGTPEAARRAMVLTLFHWGLHAWAVYCFAALVIAYFSFRKGGSNLAGTPMRVAFKGKWVEPMAWSSDLVAVLAVALGVAGSAAMGVLQLRTGLHVVADVPNDSNAWAMGIMVVLAACYMTSASTSVDKGIQLLSNANMIIAVLLLLFVLVFGPTVPLLRTFVVALGDYATELPGLSLRLFPYQEESPWLWNWTLTTFVWWIAWAPFVGIFIARISRGRTIREFVLGVVFVPTVFTLLWFAVFGGTALHEELLGGGGVVALVQEDSSAALFALFERLPATQLLSGTAVALIFTFLVTSLDSATFVLGMLTQGGTANPSTRRKLIWGTVIAIFGAALVLSGNIHAVRAVAISGALPYTFILFIQAFALFKELHNDEEPDDPGARVVPADEVEGS